MVGECQLQKNMKKKSKLVLGQVDFINCYPINIPFEKEFKPEYIKTINATPKELNKLVLNKKIDAGPVSSYFYLKNKDKLSRFGNLCIASNGPADSVLLFSKYKIKDLNKRLVTLSKTSATSNELLKILCKHFIKIKPVFKAKKDKQSDAYLLIGDAALQKSKQNKKLYVYDLGTLWKKYTGLPMVFAVWVYRNETKNKHLQKLVDLLQESKQKGLGKHKKLIIQKAQTKLPQKIGFYKTYFKNLKYDFDRNCQKGLKKFESLCD